MKFSEFLNQKQLNERVTPEFRDEFGKQETRRLMSNISNHRRAMDARINNKTLHLSNALDSDAPFDPNDPMTKFTRLSDEFVSKLRSSYSPFKLLNKIENFEGFLVKADEFSVWIKVDNTGFIEDHEHGIRGTRFIVDGKTRFKDLFKRANILCIYGVTSDPNATQRLRQIQNDKFEEQDMDIKKEYHKNLKRIDRLTKLKDRNGAGF
jgi:hypothetical protein